VSVSKVIILQIWWLTWGVLEISHVWTVVRRVQLFDSHVQNYLVEIEERQSNGKQCQTFASNPLPCSFNTLHTALCDAL
jgi:hypothetical protein